MRECCERVWLACAIDSEGSIQVWRQTSKAVSTRAYGKYDFAEAIRNQFMPNSRANGEALPAKTTLRVIPCQAEESTTSTSEGVETTRTSSASSNSAHECPAAYRVEDIVRPGGKPSRGDKEPRKDIAAR